MLPSGAAAGPSVRPPLIGAVRVNRRSSRASGETMAAPVGRGRSAAGAVVPTRSERARAGGGGGGGGRGENATLLRGTGGCGPVPAASPPEGGAATQNRRAAGPTSV